MNWKSELGWGDHKVCEAPGSARENKRNAALHQREWQEQGHLWNVLTSARPERENVSSGQATTATGSEGLSHSRQVPQLVKGQRQDLILCMAGPTASALLNYVDCLRSRQ